MGPPSEATSSLIGVGLALGAGVLIAAALNTQRLAHIRRAFPHPSSSSNPPTSPSRPSRSSRPVQHDVSEQTPLLLAPTPALKRSISDPEEFSSSSVNPQLLVPLVATSAPRERSTSPRRERSTSLASRSSKKSVRPRTDNGFLTSKLWLFGFFLLNAGEFLNFLAYGFAPPSVVAPLGMVTLVANVFLAPAIVGEPFRRGDLIGVVVAIFGGATVVYSSRNSDKKLNPDELLVAISQPLFIAYASICAIAILILSYLSRTRLGDKFVMIDLSLCATVGCFTVLATKAISGFINLDPWQMLRSKITYPVLVVLAATAVVQVAFVNKALQRFESRVVIPIQYCTFALSTIIGSAVLYRDFEGVPFSLLLNFIFGCLVCGLGVWLLTRDPPPSPTSSTTSNAPLPPTNDASNDPTSPVVAAVQPLPFAAVHPSIGRTFSGRLLPVPIAAVKGGGGGGAGGARKASWTLGCAYLLASPSGRDSQEREEGEGDEEGGERDEESAVGL